MKPVSFRADRPECHGIRTRYRRRLGVSEIAGALGLSSLAPGSSIPPGSSLPPGGAQPTISAPLGAAGPRAAPGGTRLLLCRPVTPQAAIRPPAITRLRPSPGYWPQPSAPGSVPAARTNGLAIASLVLGILWLFWLGSVVGLVLGLMALKQIRTRNQGGRGIAIAGIVLSVLWLLVLIATIIAGVAKGS